MNKRTKQRNIIIIALSCVVLLMVAGYAAFSTSLNIKGTSNISSNWNVKISGVTTKNITGTATNNSDPTFTDTSVTFKTDLKSPGDSLEYEVTVTNAGTLNAKLDKITLSDTNNSAIKFTSSGLTEGDIINAGSTGTLLVKVEFLSSVTSQPSNVSSNLTITLDYSQADAGYKPSDQTASEQLTSNLVTSGDGLYVDNYENGRYVYKGVNPNNYITFNNELWRIISVEADGSLKIVRDNSIGTKALDTNNVNNWASPSTLNVYLNGEYYNQLNNDEKLLVIEHNYDIGPVINLNNDLSAQISSEKTLNWTGKIALFSLSDYLRANKNMEQCGNFALNNENREICSATNYLFNATEQWTLASEGITSKYSYSVSILNSIYPYFPNNNEGHIRPTLYLKSDIILSGEGTKDNPYTIN